MPDFTPDWIAAQRRHDDAAAWRIADQVLRRRAPATRDDPLLPYHLRWVWDGRDYAGRDVLVRCYHGLGDTLCFARYLPALSRRARHVEVEVQPALLALLRDLPGVAGWRGFDPTHPAPPAECDIEIMELGHALRLQPEAVPPPYLHAAAEPGLRDAIGLCLRAGEWDAERSMPPELLAPALARRRVLSLEPGPARFAAENPEGAPTDIAATASRIAGIGLVITVDTMVAHLAGALGRPAWLLLKHEPDWRWLPEPSPWFPAMRRFRQPAPGDWAAVARDVAAALTARD